MELLHKELSYQIVGLCLDIYNNYGPHHKEVVYQRLLKEKFDLANLKTLWEPKIDVYSQDTNRIIGCYVPDLLVEDKIIIEVKATRINCFRNEEQILHYLKVSEYELGYLVNFGLRSFYFKRLIFTNDKKKINTKLR